jgi:hypothetical protein
MNSHPCGYPGPGGTCGAPPARLFPGGWRCPGHTPAALAGKPEPGAGRYCPPTVCWCGHCPPRQPAAARRVLVTGSRTWTDRQVIADALREHCPPGTVLVTGACPRGADALAEQLWREGGGQTERHPADWSAGRSAGMARNAAMVAAGAAVCLAFIRDNSPGASHTADLADRAGTPVHRYDHPEDQETAPSGLTLEAAARRYMAAGWPVFVLGRSKRPVANCAACKTAAPGHDLAACGCLTCHGFHAATTDPARLAAMLARLDMRPRWVRLVPWGLTAATIYLNVAGQHAWFGRVAHAVFPALWVLAVEAGVHVIRVRAGLAAGTAMDRIRRSRWLLAPVRRAGLWRRMVLWEIRSYPDALARERNRVLARTGLQDTYGALAWRWKAPRRVRALYRLGELTPARDEAVPAVRAVPVPAVPAVAPRTRPASRGKAPRKPRRSAVPDVDALMPLGWQITADLAARGLPLTRDTLAAALREAGRAAGNARVGALLARLETEAPADLADTTPDPVPALADGGN